MKLKILYLILFILIFIPIGLCEIIKEDINLNNIKIYDKNDKTIFIYDRNNEKSMDIKLISTISDIDKLIKIVEITNYIEYIPNKENDFITKIKKVYGKNDVYKIEYFIEKYNYTFENIIINKTIFNNKTGKNEIKLINKSIIKNINSFWVKFKPYNKQIFKNETFKLKIIHYKKPELGFFKIQTIPIFKNIECKEFTWWNGNWNLRRPILINNINGDNVTNYQLKSVNLSQYEINASSTRIINESSGLQESFWNESIDYNGNLEFVWCNFSNLPNGEWINSTYYLYYQSIPIFNTVSNGNTTFLKFFDKDSTSEWIKTGGLTVTTNGDYLRFFENAGGIGTAERYDLVLPPHYIMETRFKNINIGVKDECIITLCDNSSSHRKSMSLIPRDDNNVKWAYYIDPTIYIIGDYSEGTEYIYKQINNDTDLLTGSNYYLLDTNRNLLSNVIEKPVSYGLPINTNGIFIGDASRTLYIDFNIRWIVFRQYTLNEPELWTVGNIEYPERLNMTCNLKIITHLTEKNINFVNMTGDIVNTSKTNECVNLSYDSYIVYMSNPVKISSFTGLLNILDNFLVQFLLFIFLIIIATLFYVFIQIVKKKGFKL